MILFSLSLGITPPLKTTSVNCPSSFMKTKHESNTVPTNLFHYYKIAHLSVVCTIKRSVYPVVCNICTCICMFCIQVLLISFFFSIQVLIWDIPPVFLLFYGLSFVLKDFANADLSTSFINLNVLNNADNC